MRRNLLVALAVLLTVAVVVYGWRIFSSRERLGSPEELARKALQASSPREQEDAATRLAQICMGDSHPKSVRTEAKEQLRRVLGESETPQVRAACIRGLAAQWDYDSMPVFLDALDDKSPLVRGRAGAAVKRMIQAKVDFPYDAPPEEREQAVKTLRDAWQQMRDTGILEKWKKRLEEKNL